MHRSSDDPAAPLVSERSFITIDRRIPLPWLLGSLGALALVLVGMYYQQKQTAEKLSDVAGDVRLIRADMQGQGRQSLEDNFTLRELGRRLTAAEIDIKSMQSNQQQGKGKQ